MKNFKHMTADDLFYGICKELGREPTLQEFMETTNLQKSSYYRARQKYRLWQRLKNKNIDDGSDFDFEFGLIRVVVEENEEKGEKLP